MCSGIARDTIEAAFDHHRAGRLEETGGARAFRFLESPPDDSHPHAPHLLGLAALQRGAIGKAEALVAKAVALGPLATDFQLSLGGIYAIAARPTDALECFAVARGLEPDCPEAHHNAGIAYAKLGRPEEAEAAFRTASLLKPDYAEALTPLAAILQMRGREDEAVEILRQCVAAIPDYAEAHSRLGMMLLLKGEFRARQSTCSNGRTPGSASHRTCSRRSSNRSSRARAASGAAARGSD